MTNWAIASTTIRTRTRTTAVTGTAEKRCVPALGNVDVSVPRDRKDEFESCAQRRVGCKEGGIHRNWHRSGQQRERKIKAVTRLQQAPASSFA